MKDVPLFEDYLKEETALPKADQSQLVKQITKSFDVTDLKIYLKGMMLGFDISTRKRLLAYLDNGNYRKVIDHLIKDTDDDITQSRLKKLLKVFMKQDPD